MGDSAPVPRPKAPNRAIEAKQKTFGSSSETECFFFYKNPIDQISIFICVPGSFSSSLR
jgi:hypothetical protein